MRVKCLASRWQRMLFWAGAVKFGIRISRLGLWLWPLYVHANGEKRRIARGPGRAMKVDRPFTTIPAERGKWICFRCGTQQLIGSRACLQCGAGR